MTVWIALEALAGGKPQEVDRTIAEPYRKNVMRELLADLATSVSSQAYNLALPWSTSGQHLKNWYFWNRRLLVERWLERVLDPSWQFNHTKWEPQPPPFVIAKMETDTILLTYLLYTEGCKL